MNSLPLARVCKRWKATFDEKQYWRSWEEACFGRKEDPRKTNMLRVRGIFYTCTRSVMRSISTGGLGMYASPGSAAEGSGRRNKGTVPKYVPHVGMWIPAEIRRLKQPRMRVLRRLAWMLDNLVRLYALLEGNNVDRMLVTRMWCAIWGLLHASKNRRVHEEVGDGVVPQSITHALCSLHSRSLYSPVGPEYVCFV
jgi:hypothetical protein